MIELKIKVEEKLVKTLGEKALEIQLEDFLQKLMARIAAKEIIADLPVSDMTNDPKWQIARTLAWKTEKEKYLPTT